MATQETIRKGIIYTDKTECGQRWENLKTGCPQCNGGAHYHYANGACDLEPCVRHGGPR